MQNKIKDSIADAIVYLLGNREILENMDSVKPTEPFSEKNIEFCSLISKNLLAAKEAKAYPDIITFAFWIRKAEIEKQKKRFTTEKGSIRLGRGTVFHIAPSNVPVNYAYSLAVGLITGNANIVRVSSKDFPQIEIINGAVKKALEQMPEMASYICLIRYGHNQEINDYLSSICDVRVVWGGNNTIKELRQSEIKPRSTEVMFADRYSLCIIDSDYYIELEDKEKIAERFYNDTYLTDQNACTSPSMIIWTGKRKEEAKKLFWKGIYFIAQKKYSYQAIQGINKLENLCRLAAAKGNVKQEVTEDNLLIRIKVEKLCSEIMDYKGNCGYFLEYDCENIEEIECLCGISLQTLSYIGNNDKIMCLLRKGVKGIDRIVAVGQTMDFDFIWDGYNLLERLSRQILIY